MEFFIALIVLFGIIAVIILIVNYFEKQRTAALEKVAEELQMTFRQKDENNIFLGALSHLALMNKGRSRSRKIYNIFLGPETGFSLSLFDYQYTVGSGKNSSNYSQTIAMVKSDDFNLPRFNMQPENIFHKIGTAFGMQDIDFEDYPQFSKQYLLKGENEAEIRAFFKPQLLQFFTEHTGWSLEGGSRKLLIYKSNRRVSAEEIRDFMKEALSIANEFQALSLNK